MSASEIISLGVAICALIFTALSFRRNQYHDNSMTASERATMAIKRDITEMKTKIAEIDQSTRSAHKRLDDLIKG